MSNSNTLVLALGVPVVAAAVLIFFIKPRPAPALNCDAVCKTYCECNPVVRRESRALCSLPALETFEDCRDAKAAFTDGKKPKEAALKLCADFVAKSNPAIVQILTTASDDDWADYRHKCEGEATEKERVLSLKHRVVELRGAYEAKERYPSKAGEYQKQSADAARELFSIDDARIDDASRILKWEYGAWATLLASIFSNDPAEKETYANTAIERFTKVERMCDEIILRAASDDARAVGLREWIEGPSNDTNRIRVLHAMAIDQLGKLGKKASREEATALLDRTDGEYKVEWKIDKDPELQWVLRR